MSGLRMSMNGPVFATDYRVIYGDTDAGGVVYNANYLRFFEIGRSELMRAWVIPYSEIESMGLILPVTESYLRYKAPARYDDLIRIRISLAEVKKVSCRFHYRITRPAGESSRLLVKGFTNHACVNQQGRLTPLPDDLRRRMEQILEQEKATKTLSGH
jgi:acyl-CoA thioester hydrolase